MKRGYLPIIFLTFVNILNFSVLIPVLPFIVKQYGGGATLYGLLLSIYPFAQFFAAPMLGTLSDKYGRRPILLISQAGTLLSWIVFAIAYFTPEIYVGPVMLPIIVLILARTFDGITGGNNSVANAYLSDITTREEKTKAFGMLGGVVGVGLILGPALGGLSMSTGLGYLGPVLVTMLISVTALVLLYKYLPESLPPSRRDEDIHFRWQDEIQFITKLKKYTHIRRVRYVFFLRAFFLLVFSSYGSIFVLFMIDTFDFDSQSIGLFFFVVGFFLIFNQVIVAQYLSRKFGNLKTLIFGHIAVIISQCLFVFVPNFILFLPVAYINNLGISVSMPTFKALLSNSVDEKKQGEILGIDESFLAASSAISPLIATYFYQHIGAYTFIFLGCILTVAVVVFEMRKGWKKVKPL